MPKKILTFDLDGTLINSNNEIIGGEKTIELIRKFHDEGFELIVNTGRLDHDIRYICNQYQLPIDVRISQNGCVISSDKEFQASLLDINEAAQFYESVKDMNLRVELNTVSNRYWLSDRHPDFPKEYYDSSKIVESFDDIITYQPIVLFLLIAYPDEINETQRIVSEQFPKLQAVKTSDTSLEILTPGVSKGSTLRELYPNAEVYAIGDSENDFSLFDDAKAAYLVGNKGYSKAKTVPTILEALKEIYTMTR